MFGSFRRIARRYAAWSVACLMWGGSLAAQDASPAAPPEIPDTNVEASPSNEPIVVEGLDPIVDGWRFGNPRADGYRAGTSTSGTIIALPDGDVPGTVNSITESLLRDQQALRFDDVIRNAGGTTTGGDSLFADRIYLRGIELQSRDFRKDGFLDPTYVPRDFQNVERVEILKGPASVLYGSSSPAGMVNLITKKPLDASFADFGFTFGSWNQQRYTADVNGRASQAGDVLYRLNVAHEDVGSFRDFGFVNRTLVAPSATWNLSDDTRITWLGEWHRDHRRGDQGYPMVGGDPLALPPSRYVGEPANDFIHFEEFRQTLLLSHDLSDDWTFQLGGSSLFYQFPGSVTSASGNPAPGFFPDVPEPYFYRSRTNIVKENEQSQSMLMNLAGEFETGGLVHKALVGMEYVYFDSDSFYSFGAVNPIDVSNPTYVNPPMIPFGATGFPAYRQQRVGGYLQDLVELTPEWKVLGGVRFDTLDLQFNRVLIFGPPDVVESDQRFNRVTPRGGVVYQPFADDTLAFYFNYSQSFSPPGGGIYVNDTPLKPVLGQGYEAGVKTLLLDNLTLNAAGFYATRQNADLNTSSFFLVQVGEERSQGVEVNLLGAVTERWSVTTNYTYSDVLLSDPLNPQFDGKRQRNVPYNTANVWTRYDLLKDDVHTFGAALGLVYSDRRPGDLVNTFELPSYGRWDAGLFYNRGALRAGLYAENLFDVAYAASSLNSYQIFPGAPANLRAQIGFTY